MTGPDPEHWFLSPAERGNPHTSIDRGRDKAWTSGNDVTVLVDGAQYFPCLHDEILATGAGDWLYLTDLEGDGDERLSGPGTEIRAVLADAARRGVALRGLLWRSHAVGHAGGELDNVRLSRTVNDAGGELVLDHRVRRGGSHHQKIVVIQRASRPSPDDDVAFVGGIDLAHGRNDGACHEGDPQPADRRRRPLRRSPSMARHAAPAQRVRRSPTSRTRSANGGRIPTRSTRRARGECSVTG